MTEQVFDIRNKTKPVFTRHGVSRASVFGSCARGDNGSESDVDLLVELPKGTGMFAYMRLKRELESALGRSVDLVTFRSVHPALKPYIERDMVALM